MFARSILTSLLFLFTGLQGIGEDRPGSPQAFPLAGSWRFELDPQNQGITDSWFKRPLADRCQLPGSTDENGFGNSPTTPPDYNVLTRLKSYVGPAWYQRDVDIPASWAGLRVTLSLERCHWETRLWVDGIERGMRDSLCVPHVYDLGQNLAPGSHQLTLRVDNTLKYDMGAWAHSTSEQTQTNWNGIIGRIELKAWGPVVVTNLQVYPDVDARRAKVRLKLLNFCPGTIPVHVRLGVSQDGASMGDAEVDIQAAPGETPVESDVQLSSSVKLWDEFSPVLCQLKAEVSATSDGRTLRDEASVEFGMRHLGVTEDKMFQMNGRPLLLRGTLECCIFPKTGYPSMDVDSWLRIFHIAQSYGLNHMRFHSWCPPEAAFVAADQTGFLLHVEAPQWVNNVGQVPDRDAFIEEEEARILQAYGNHPSFGFLCMGNELAGDPVFLQKLVKKGKDSDPRHLYTPSTWMCFGPEDQYRVMAIRGLQGPKTDHDFRKEVAQCPVPVISHEVGQWAVYPNMEEIEKYTGVLRPRNLELIREDLSNRHMLEQARDFTRASGALSVLLYKEEIEVLLRTPNHAGFQLLDLHDFPGQGTALVGTLDAFWDSKGLISPEAYRRFCGPTVPLLRIPKRTYNCSETFKAQAEIVHAGPKPLDRVQAVWSVKEANGQMIDSGSFPEASIPTGARKALGDIVVDLSHIKGPKKLTVSVGLKSTSIENDWDVWVYPDWKPLPDNPDTVSFPDSSGKKVSAVRAGKDILLFEDWDPAILQALESGRKVLFCPSRRSLSKSLPGSFTPVFWSPIWFKNGAQTMGILCDPHHPALSEFPTEFHTNWQWYDLLERSSSMVLDDLDPSFEPIVQVIDNFSRNHRLANLFEAKVGAGCLMVCSIDIRKDLENRPAAQQLRESLIHYMESKKFNPNHTLRPADLSLLFKSALSGSMVSLGATILSVDSQEPDNPATAAIDGDPDTCWHTQWRSAQPGHPHRVKIDLKREVKIAGFRYVPRQDMVNGRIRDYEFHVSQDGLNWGEPVARGQFESSAEEQKVLFKTPLQGRYVSLTALSEVQSQPFTSIAELDVIPDAP